MNMIELKRISKNYDKTVVLKNLNFTAKERGNIYTIIGRSGSVNTADEIDLKCGETDRTKRKKRPADAEK